ncbi:acyltransferase [Zalerion maritima]|uniref:Acyltransferase n=1 Tax=Zalerion maritima TaxID=339359 RepID=A0AAD5RTF0_9PEZI|nr:acyltransferase [Zalerion maritima]
MPSGTCGLTIRNPSPDNAPRGSIFTLCTTATISIVDSGTPHPSTPPADRLPCTVTSRPAPIETFIRNRNESRSNHTGAGPQLTHVRTFKMATITTALTTLRGLALTIPWLLHLLIADMLLSLLLPLKPLLPDLVYNLSSLIAFTVWRSIQVIFETFNSAQITFSGDALPPGESAVVVANHVGWADFYMIQALAIKSGMLSRQRYFAKRELRNVPFLGWGLWAMGMPMVSRNWLRDEKELKRVFEGVIERRWPTWLISFAEGTRFSPLKHAESARFCSANNKPQPKNLLYPRSKGFITTINHLRSAPHVKAVYVLTIAYQKSHPSSSPGAGEGQHGGGVKTGGGSIGKGFQEAPTMWETLSKPNISAGGGGGGGGYKFHANAKRYLMEDLPKGDDEKLAKWLEDRWVEKGEWLEGMKDPGAKEWNR